MHDQYQQKEEDNTCPGQQREKEWLFSAAGIAVGITLVLLLTLSIFFFPFSYVVLIVFGAMLVIGSMRK